MTVAPHDAQTGTPVSTVEGDRVCTSCGYNLTGQTVFREPHYDLFIVRCPECATVTSLLEYPALGRWGNRWATVLATLWFIFLIAMLFPSTMAPFGLSIVAGEIGTDPFASLLERTRADAAGAPSFTAWWPTIDLDTLVAQNGGWWSVFDASTFFMLVPVTLAGFTIGWFWSVALLPLPRRWLPLVAIVIVGLATILVVTQFADWRNDTMRNAWQAARAAYGPWIILINLAYWMFPLTLGLMLGRPLTRGLASVLLPRSLVRGVGFLWRG